MATRLDGVEGMKSQVSKSSLVPFLALEYTGSEVNSGCTNVALGNKSSLVPFIFQARNKNTLGKSTEEQERTENINANSLSFQGATPIWLSNVRL